MTPTSPSTLLAPTAPSGLPLGPGLRVAPADPWSTPVEPTADLAVQADAWSASGAIASDLLSEAEETVEEWYAEADAEISHRLDEATGHMEKATQLAIEAGSLVEEVRALRAEAATDRVRAGRELEDAVESGERILAQARAERDRLIATAGEEAARLRAEGRRALALTPEAATSASASAPRRTWWRRVLRRH